MESDSLSKGLKKKLFPVEEFGDLPNNGSDRPPKSVEEGIQYGESYYDNTFFDKFVTEPYKTSYTHQVGGDHYRTLKIQPIEYIMANDLSWCEGNIVKYITRWKQKGGKQDIEKVIHYAQLLLDSLEGGDA